MSKEVVEGASLHVILLMDTIFASGSLRCFRLHAMTFQNDNDSMPAILFHVVRLGRWGLGCGHVYRPNAPVGGAVALAFRRIAWRLPFSAMEAPVLHSMTYDMLIKRFLQNDSMPAIF